MTSSSFQTQRLFLYFYAMINVGALASLCTIFAEKGVGVCVGPTLLTEARNLIVNPIVLACIPTSNFTLSFYPACTVVRLSASLSMNFQPLIFSFNRYGNKTYVKTPPRGSVVVESWRVFVLAAKGKWSLNPITLIRRFTRKDFWDSAKPSFYAGGEHGSQPKGITWDDEFVDEVYRAVKACKVL
jgi:hypothetical protein